MLRGSAAICLLAAVLAPVAAAAGAPVVRPRPGTARPDPGPGQASLRAEVEPPIAAAPALDLGFAGPGWTGVAPANPSIAAGTTTLLLVVNGSIALMSATGVNRGQVTLNGFFNGSLAGGSVFDARAIWDPHAQRFIVVALDGRASPDSWLRIAVARSEGPQNLSVGTGAAAGWWGYNVDADQDGGAQANANWAAFPNIGVDDTNLYVSANMYDAGGVFRYVKLWVLPKAGLLAGGPVATFEFGAPPAMLTNPGTGVRDSSLVPAQNRSTGAAHLIAANALQGQFGHLTLWTVGSPTGTPTLTAQDILVPGWNGSAVPACPQLGGGTPIDTGDTRLLRAVERDGTLWTAHTTPNAASGATRAQVRWYAVMLASATAQVGTVDDPQRCYFQPAIEPDAAGNAALVMAGVDATSYVAAYYTARAASDAEGTMQPPSVLHGGLANYVALDPQGRNRWGDWGSIDIDPNGADIWLFHAYAATNDKWATWVGRVDAGGVAVPSTTTTTSTLRLTTTTATLPADGDGDGVPDGADACGDTPSGELIGADGCSLCPCAGLDGMPWPTRRAYLDCVRRAVKQRVRAGLLGPSGARAATKRARLATCGRPLTRCCVTPRGRGGVRCRLVAPARCLAPGGRDVGAGSCVPVPCAD